MTFSPQVKSLEVLVEIFSMVTDVLERAAAMDDPAKGRDHVTQGLEGLRERMGVPASDVRKSDGERVEPNQCIDLSY